MASLTLNFSIGDVFSPLRSLYNSIVSKEKLQTYVYTFDQFAFRIIVMIILIATTFLTIMCVPYVIHSIELIFKTIANVSKILTLNPKTTSSLIQLTTMLPLFILLLE